jgi:hypothetical protein
LVDYESFLLRSQKFHPGHLGEIYALLGNFRQILREFPLPPRPEHLQDGESVAWEEGQRRGIRERLLRDCAEALFHFHRRILPAQGSGRRLAIVRLVKYLGEVDRAAWLLSMNCQESAALERIFLAPLRIRETPCQV